MKNIQIHGVDYDKCVVCAYERFVSILICSVDRLLFVNARVSEREKVNEKSTANQIRCIINEPIIYNFYFFILV